jgi:hypothetical protein
MHPGVLFDVSSLLPTHHLPQKKIRHYAPLKKEYSTYKARNL